MSVYVDQAAHPFGRMVMCHMIADTPAELRDMAVAIGVQLRWFQAQASTPHFDIALTKRARALRAGAVELERRPFVEAMKRIRATWPVDSGGRWILPAVHTSAPALADANALVCRRIGGCINADYCASVERCEDAPLEPPSAPALSDR